MLEMYGYGTHPAKEVTCRERFQGTGRKAGKRSEQALLGGYSLTDEDDYGLVVHDDASKGDFLASVVHDSELGGLCDELGRREGGVLGGHGHGAIEGRSVVAVTSMALT